MMDPLDSSTPDVAGADLVRRMSHDFNNLFSIALGGLTLLREEIREEAWTGEAHEVYEDVLSATREAAEVVARLTSWAGRQALSPEQVDLRAVALEAVAAARERAGGALPAIEVTAEEAPGWADRLRLREALCELLLNAADATGADGVVRVAVVAGDAPEVKVIDSGCGMDAEVAAACRAPFFTTRAAQGRRGLGLSVADGFARASGGSLAVETAPETGTCVTIRLPGMTPAC